MTSTTQIDNTVTTIQTSMQWQRVLNFGIEDNDEPAVKANNTHNQNRFEVMP